MRTVWKFEVPLTSERIELRILRNADILDLQLQRGMPCIWAAVDTDEPKEAHAFAWVGTGHDPGIARVWKHTYIGSVQPSPDFVFHLFRTE